MALIDFGLCAEVPLPDTRNMTLAIVHLMQGDVPGLLEDAIELGFLPQDVNKETLLPGMNLRILNHFRAKITFYFCSSITKDF